MRHAILAGLGGAALVALAWFGSSQAQAQLQLKAVVPTCAPGFTASGTTKGGYTCTSARFVCTHNMNMLFPKIISGHRAQYTCAFPVP